MMPLIVKDLKRHHQALCEEEDALRAREERERREREDEHSHRYGTRTTSARSQLYENATKAEQSAVQLVTTKRQKLAQMIQIATELAAHSEDIRPSNLMRKRSLTAEAAARALRVKRPGGGGPAAAGGGSPNDAAASSGQP